MSIKNSLEVILENKLPNEAKELFIEFHNSKSWRSPAKYNFILKKDNEIIGAALFGHLTSFWATKKYGKNTIELKKFVTINDTEKNTESYFLAKCIKHLKNTEKYAKIITYADPKFGHQGTLYKATNFVYLGQGKTNYIYQAKDKSFYQERAVYQKNKKGEYLPSAKKLQNDYNTGKLNRFRAEGKHIFKFEL